MGTTRVIEVTPKSGLDFEDGTRVIETDSPCLESLLSVEPLDRALEALLRVKEPYLE